VRRGNSEKGETEMNAGAIKTRVGIMWMDEALGIIRCVHFAGSECTLEDAKENVAAQVRLANGKVIPLLVDLTKCKSVSKEARVHFASATSAFCSVALLSASPVGRIIGNMFIAVYGAQGAPTKLFTSEAAAIEWLKGFMK
jgi:hypothetical protein